MMALSLRKSAEALFSAKWLLRRDFRALSTLPEKAEEPTKTKEQRHAGRRSHKNPLLELRHVYPEFLPDPKPEWRNSLREKLERADMIQRRSKVDIPEFYVGSILAVSTSDPHSQTKTNRFVGICIERKGCGLRAEFTLRNVIDHQGMEVRYELYDPTIQNIQVLRLEKRLDDKLYYLRDALPEYSTFPLDMDPEILPEGAVVPINPVQVQLKPRPWLERWERQGLKGVANIEEIITTKHRRQREKTAEPWRRWDMMEQYRKTIPVEEQSDIWAEVYKPLSQIQTSRKKVAKKRIISTPKSHLG